jgi:hypothetical protein
MPRDVVMPCPVCLGCTEVVHGVVMEHQDGVGGICPMSGEPAPLWDEGSTRQAVRGRSGGICEYCSRQRATDMHHRISVGIGGWWSPAQILHVCRGCHMWITDHPGFAVRRGLSLPHEASPAHVPVKKLDGTYLVLTNDLCPPVPTERRRR